MKKIFLFIIPFFLVGQEADRPYDFFTEASFLYWQPIQENMSLGVVSNASSANDLVNGDVVDLDFTYKPGFKVGFGVSFDYGMWDTFLSYTWLRGSQKASVNINPNNLSKGLFPSWEIPSFLNPRYNKGSEKWTLQLHLINWDLSQNYAVGTKLCLRPFIGLRAAIIDQDLHVQYENENPVNAAIFPDTHIDISTDSWGIGPRLGLCTNWHLRKGWRLFGDGEFDILFTQYDTRSEQRSDVAIANRFTVRHDDANFLRTHLGLDLGLGWGRYFSCDKYHVDLSAGYGFQVFFDQNMLRRGQNAQAIGSSFAPEGNLYLHGFTLTLRFDY
ncbi:MAG: hypothetical protein ChlgKO_04670 [Chlamydiales bacterium]